MSIKRFVVDRAVETFRRAPAFKKLVGPVRSIGIVDLAGFVGLPSLALMASVVLPNFLIIPVAVVAASAYFRFLEPIATMRLASHLRDQEGSGIFNESRLLSELEAEIARSTRFGHQFAVVSAATDELHRRFDYRRNEDWLAAWSATGELLKKTRMNVDRVYRHGSHSFVIVLPESGPEAVAGMVRRMRRLAKQVSPREGEPGGPLPLAYGASFYPSSAQTAQDLVRRSDLALRLAKDEARRLHLDGAEAANAPSPESLRREGRQRGRNGPEPAAS